MPPKTIDALLSRPVTRKRAAAANYAESEDQDSEKENETTNKKRKVSATKSAAAKPIATTRAAPKAKPVVKPKSASKSTAGTKKSTLDAKSAKKLYADTIKALEAKHRELDRKVQKAVSGRGCSTNTDTFAAAVVKHIKEVSKVAEADNVLGFNLLMAVVDISHVELDIHVKMCGFGNSEEVFAKLDAILLPLIEAREKPDEYIAESGLPEVSHRWTPKDTMVGEFKTGRPNKQQRGQMYTERMGWEKERRSERRHRRENCEDWVTVALDDLKSERDYLRKYGVEGYLPKSIAALEALVDV